MGRCPAPATASSITPDGVATDADGNVYVADCDNHRIQKFDSDGTFVAKWGSAGTGDGQFERPSGVAIDAAGNVYVADTDNNRIQKFDSDGHFIDKVGRSRRWRRPVPSIPTASPPTPTATSTSPTPTTTESRSSRYVNASPTDISLTNNSVAENTPQGTDVGELSSTDPDLPAQSFTYSLVTGTGDTNNNDFQVTGNTLEVKNPLDFEAGATRSVRIRATDSGSPAQSFEKQFTITVTDVNETPARHRW